MSLFPWLPFTNFHELNLDWILKKIRGYDDRIDEVNQRQDEIETMLDNVEDTIEATARDVVQDAIDNGEFDDELAQLVQPIESQITTINQNVTALEDRVEQVETDWSNFQTETFPEFQEEVQAVVDQAQKRLKDMTVLFVGGSYSTDEVGTGYSFVDRIADQGIFKAVYNCAVGGTGFTGKAAGAGIGNEQPGNTDKMWVTITKSWINSHPRTSPKIDAVYIIGGFNDVYSDYNQIRAAIANYAGEIKPLLPNAELYLGLLAWCGKATSNQGSLDSQYSGMIKVPASSPYQFVKSSYLRRRIARIVQPAYSGCSAYGIHYLGNLNGALHNYYQDFLADGYHPSTQGQINITKMVVSRIRGGGSFIDEYNTIECHYNQSYTSTAGIAIPPANETLVLGQGTYTDQGIYFNPIVDGTQGQYFSYTALDDVGTNQASMNTFQLVIDSQDRACILPAREIAIPCFIRGTFRDDNATTGVSGFIRIYQGHLSASEPDYLQATTEIREKTDVSTSLMDCRIGVAIVPLGGKIMQAGNTYNVRMLDIFLPFDAC